MDVQPHIFLYAGSHPNRHANAYFTGDFHPFIHGDFYLHPFDDPHMDGDFHPDSTFAAYGKRDTYRIAYHKPDGNGDPFQPADSLVYVKLDAVKHGYAHSGACDRHEYARSANLHSHSCSAHLHAYAVFHSFQDGYGYRKQFDDAYGFPYRDPHGQPDTIRHPHFNPHHDPNRHGHPDPHFHAGGCFNAHPHAGPPA